MMRLPTWGIVLAACSLAAPALAAEGDYTMRDFAFRSGEKLPELRIHYLTLGKPLKDARGRTTNAVLILHGTGGTGRQFLAPQFAGVLYGPGAPLDTTKLFLVLPDGIGHGAPASRATSCTLISRVTTTTTWWRRSTGCSPRDSG